MNIFYHKEHEEKIHKAHKEGVFFVPFVKNFVLFVVKEKFKQLLKN